MIALRLVRAFVRSPSLGGQVIHRRGRGAGADTGARSPRCGVCSPSLAIVVVGEILARASASRECLGDLFSNHIRCASCGTRPPSTCSSSGSQFYDHLERARRRRPVESG